MTRSIVIDGHTYIYEFEPKRIKNINLRIRPDGSIYVSAPKRVSLKAVEEFLLSKKDFILSALDKINEKNVRHPRPDVIEDGTKVLVFGQPMYVSVNNGNTNSIQIFGNEVVIFTRYPDDPQKVTRVYNKWRTECLRARVLELAEEVCPEFTAMGAKPPTAIKFRTMKSRWGSCKPKERVLTFNYNLFEAPDECVRYVVVHEFSHLLVPNHSARFYKIVGRIMPDWREQRRRLNEY